jgi:hypothetical protein
MTYRISAVEIYVIFIIISLINLVREIFLYIGYALVSPSRKIYTPISDTGYFCLTFLGSRIHICPFFFCVFLENIIPVGQSL